MTAPQITQPTTTRPSTSTTPQHQNDNQTTTTTRTRAKITKPGTPMHADPMVIVARPGGHAPVITCVIDNDPAGREAAPC